MPPGPRIRRASSGLFSAMAASSCFVWSFFRYGGFIVLRRIGVPIDWYAPGAFGRGGLGDTVQNYTIVFSRSDRRHFPSSFSSYQYYWHSAAGVAPNSEASRTSINIIDAL